MKYIYLGLSILALFLLSACQQEEFSIAEKSKCFDNIKVRLFPDGGPLGWDYVGKERIRIAQPFFHPYKNALLIYLYYYPKKEDGPVSFASYDFETGESRIIANEVGYGFPPALSTKDWMAFNTPEGMMMVKLNGDSLQLAVPGAGSTPPTGWSVNGDTLYFQKFKTYKVGADWRVISDEGKTPESRGLSWSRQLEVFFDSDRSGNQIFVVNYAGDTIETIIDPVGNPGGPAVLHDGLAWFSRKKEDNVPVSSYIWYERSTGRMKQIRKSNYLHGYETMSISPDGKYLVGTWKSWKKKDGFTLEIIHEPRIMDIEGCDERKLVLPEPQ